MSGAKDDLADVPRRFHQRMRLRRVGEVERCMDHRFDLALLEQRPDVLA